MKLYDTINALPPGKTKTAVLAEMWPQLYSDAIARDASRGFLPMAANTYSATLVTSFLESGSVTDLQNNWAPLRAFNVNYTTDPIKPLAPIVLKHVVSGSTAQTDATNFESGNSNVGVATATPHQYTVSFQVSNADLQSGLTMLDLIKVNTAAFANKLIEVATVPLTAAIFTVPPLISSAAAFGFSDLATLQGLLTKSPVKNLILDGSFIARIANMPNLLQKVGVLGGDENGWKAFGWDSVTANSDWAGAGSNVKGFACNPQAIAGITGLPIFPPASSSGAVDIKTATVPGLGAKYAIFSWYNPSTRTLWASFDIVGAFKEVDTSCGVLVTSG